MKFRGVDYYYIDELLSDEEKMTRNLVREFSEREVERGLVKKCVNVRQWRAPLPA